MSKLSGNLLLLRKEKNFTQKQAAEEIGLNLRSYQRYETGEREPVASTLIQIADYYHITLDELVGRILSV